MPKKRYNLEKILTLAEGEQVPGPSQLEVTPEGLVKTPNQTRVEGMMSQALSPVTAPEATSVPKLIVNTTLDDLGLTPKEERPRAREMQSINDAYGIDKEHVKKLILEQEQEQNLLQQLQDQIRTTPLAPNLKPLAALLDAQTGGKLAQAMPEGVTREDRAKQLADIEKLIIGAKQGATDDALKILGSDLRYKTDLAQLREGRFQQAQTARLEKEMQDDLNKSVINPMSDVESGLNTIDANLARGDLQGLSDSLVNYAKTVQGHTGVLSNQDMGMVIPKSLEMSAANINAWLKGDKSVPIEKDTLDSLRKGIAIAKENAQKVLSKKLQLKRDIYSNRLSTGALFSPGGSGERMFDIVKGNYFSAPQAPQPDMSLVEAAKAERARRMGGK